MLEFLSEWYFELHAAFIVLVVIGTGVITLLQGRRR
jgi:hypothetical protein